MPRILLFLSLLAGSIGVIEVLYATKLFGPGINADSIAYISAASSFVKGDGFQTYLLDRPLDMWPPMYPIMLSLGHVFNIAYVEFSRLLCAVSFFATILLTGIFALRILRDHPVMAMIPVFHTTLAMPMLSLFTGVWSETVFIPIILGALIFFNKFIISKNTRHLIAFSVLAGISFITRYPGITLIVFGNAGILLFMHTVNSRRRIYFLIIMNSISFLPGLLWIIRNFLIFGTPFGIRISQNSSFLEMMMKAIRVQILWVAPTLTVGLLTLFICICMGIFRLIRQKPIIHNYSVYITILYIFIYNIFIIWSSSRFYVYPPDDRYMSPVFIPVNILFLAMVAFLMKEFFHGAWNSRLILILACSCFLWLGYVGKYRSSLTMLNYRAANGAGDYSTRAWHESPCLAFLNQGKLKNSMLYSNAPEAIFLFTNKRANWVPLRMSIPDGNKVTPESLRGIWPPRSLNKSYIIIFKLKEFRSQRLLLNLDEISRIVHLTPTNHFSDATIYEIRNI